MLITERKSIFDLSIYLNNIVDSRKWLVRNDYYLTCTIAKCKAINYVYTEKACNLTLNCYVYSDISSWISKYVSNINGKEVATAI